jgi:invasion protein IalB
MSRLPHRALVALSALSALAASVAATAAPPLPSDSDTAVAAADVERLQVWYLGCDHASRSAVLGRDTARACSLVAESLLRRGFGGDFERLLAWWRAERDRAVASSAR